MGDAELSSDVARAVAVVKNLTGKGSLPPGTQPMPVGELAYCAGLGFTFVKKAGLGVTVAGGHGFVIRKLDGGKWSAPYFIKMQSAGLGLSLGFSEFESITILDTPEAVQAMAGGTWTLDTEVSAAAGGLVGHPVGGHASATTANLSNFKLSDKTFAYSVAKGALLDVSWTGVRYAGDDARNKAAYGEGASVQAVLEGGAAPPEAVAELYAALAEALA